MNNSILEIKNVSKEFKSKERVLEVLKAVNLTIQEGEFVSILGYSGCGKSTLLRVVAGFEEVDSGEVLLQGKKRTGPNPDIFMVFQDFNQLFIWKTLKENLMFTLKHSKQYLNRQEREEVVLDFLEKVGLREFANQYPHQLSGGMKQRAAVARGLILKPKVILMDEPFGSLDAITRKKLQNVIKELFKLNKQTVLFVTHDIEEAVFLSDRIVIMDKEKKSIKNHFQINQNELENNYTKKRELYEQVLRDLNKDGEIL